MRLKNVDLEEATKSYIVANTPLFLLRKLSEDPIVQRIAATLSHEQLAAALEASLIKKPRSLEAQVKPFVYLVAMAEKEDYSALSVAANLNAPYHEWFNYLANALLTRNPPISRTSISLNTLRSGERGQEKKVANTITTIGRR